VTSLISISDVLNSKLHKQLLWPDEIRTLLKAPGSAPAYYAAVEMNDIYFARWQNLLFRQNERRGEVALVVRNQNGDILLHTKPFYPGGIFRIPTGGIQADEGVIDGMVRELQEETSFHPKSFQFISLLLYEFKNGSQSLPFVSYIFEIEPNGAVPEAGDPGEQISDFLWSPLSDIRTVIEKLHALDGSRWQDWGAVRAVPHEIYFQYSMRRQAH